MVNFIEMKYKKQFDVKVILEMFAQFHSEHVLFIYEQYLIFLEIET